MSLLSNGAIYEGELNMFGSVYKYVLNFVEFQPTGMFRYKHSVYMGNYLADSKEGDGRFEHIDESNAKIIYSDPETAFEGVINMTTGHVEGTASQVNGMCTGLGGTFKLAFKQFE